MNKKTHINTFVTLKYIITTCLCIDADEALAKSNRLCKLLTGIAIGICDSLLGEPQIFLLVGDTLKKNSIIFKLIQPYIIFHYFMPVHGEVYSIHHYVITFISDLRQVGGFLRFPPIKTDCHDITEILLKMALNSINQIKLLFYDNF